MEITSFYPRIATNDIEATKATYEALGFKVAHVVKDPSDELMDKHEFIIMKNDNGLRVCLFSGPENGDVTTQPGSVWMNVRDFDAACDLLKERGFTVCSDVYDLDYSKTVAMMAPEGYAICVVYHKRKGDWK